MFRFVKLHPRFIYKPAEDAGGNGIRIYDSKQSHSIKELFDGIVVQGACVLEELISQGEELSRIHSGSVNTVRYVTYRKSDGTVIVIGDRNMNENELIVTLTEKY